MSDHDQNENKGIISWFTRNSVAANLLMIMLIFSGLVSLGSLKRETFPEGDSTLITVSVIYPGAAPEEVEEGICRKIEEAVQGVTGIKQITSSSNENAGAVSIEVMREYDLREVLDDVKSRVDAIDTFPVEAEEPVVQEMLLTRQSINVALSGKMDEKSLKAWGERLRNEISRLPGITYVTLANARDYEIAVEISEQALRQWGLTFDDVANAIRRSSLDLPGGTIKVRGGEVLLRTKAQGYIGRDFEEIVILSRPDGTRIHVKDVATVTDGFEENERTAYFDGERSVLVQVYRVGDQDVLKIVNTVKEYIDKVTPTLPEGLKLTTWMDETKFLKGRINLLTKNLVGGLALVFLVLALFLRLRLAFWVALGIPVSFLGCVALMPTLGISVNMISLFAFILVLGIVVDDAIVVGENVFTKRETIRSGIRASIIGSKQVAVPVTFGVLTTMAAFSPMLNVNDNFRKIWQDIALIVMFCLLFSLIESKLILPAHLAHMRYDDPNKKPSWFVPRAWKAVQGFFTRSLEWFIQKTYRPVLERALRYRYTALAAFLGVLVLTIGFVAGGYVKFIYFPSVEGDNVVATLSMPQGTPVDVTRNVVRRLEREALALAKDLEQENGTTIVEHVLSSVGEQPYLTMQRQNQGQNSAAASGQHIGEVNIQLVDAELRPTVSSDGVLRRWRKRIGQVPDVEELSFTSSLFNQGSDIKIRLRSDDSGHLVAGSDKLKAHLATYPGTASVTDSFRIGKREVKLTITPAAEALGLTQRDLARQVRQAFYGEEVQRVQRGRDDIKVMVRYPLDERRSLGNLEDMLIRAPNGAEVPFATVAKARHGRGYATIQRASQSRIVDVTADVEAVVGKTEMSANEIVAKVTSDFLPKLMNEFPGMSYTVEGDRKDQQDSMASLIRGFLLALVLIYTLMAIPFKNYMQPFIVMIAIPFGFVGSVIGHVVMGLELSIMSMFGLIALTGVVINDSLVLVDYINQRYRSGTPVFTAVHDAGLARFRPILLTSLTTFASLTPLLLERSLQAQFLIPMATSLGFGVLFATFITLVLVPVTYMITRDVRNIVRWLIGRDPLPDTRRVETEKFGAEAPPVLVAAAGGATAPSLAEPSGSST